MQELIVKAEVLESFLSDHSSVAIKICLSEELRNVVTLFTARSEFFKELQKYFNELKTQDRENVIVE